jgi:tetratricopeptide (TPR) repeat protein
MEDFLRTAGMALALVKGIWPAIKNLFGQNVGSPSNDEIEIFQTSWEGRPASLGENFVGRQEDLDCVAESMGNCGGVVISGGAGTGKSRLAAEYIYSSSSHGYWTSAGASAQQTLAALAPRFEIDTAGLNDGEIAAAVSREVASLPKGLVWVIDNLLEFGQLEEIRAATGPLNLLVTSRDSSRQLLPLGMIFVALEVLERDPGVNLLRSRGAGESDEKVLTEIAGVVGYLPLALEMLAVRLGEPLADAGSVLAELNEAPNPLLVRAFENAARQALMNKEEVYSAITGSLHGLGPETREIISPFGYLADEPIPLPLAMALTNLEKDGLGQLLAECRYQSVLGESQEHLFVHALTSAAIAVTNEEAALGETMRAANTRLLTICGDDPVAMRAEASHHLAIYSHAARRDALESTFALSHTSNLAIGFRTIGRVEEAVDLCEKTLESRVRVFGEEHEDTLGTRSNLANFYREIGRTEEAVDLDEKTLKARVRLLGEEHEDTFATRNNLAIGYRMLGRTEEAVSLHRETLSLMERLLGAEHPLTLSTRTGLANGYISLGRMEEAADLEEKTLEISRRVLGTEHPDTLISRNNLAAIFAREGRTQEAIELFEETIELTIKVFGTEHPNTLICRISLINAYKQAGRCADAETLAADPRFPA